MSTMSKSLREKMQSKARKLANQKDQKVDSSDWSPEDEPTTSNQVGQKPTGRQGFKAGGKVNYGPEGNVGGKKSVPESSMRSSELRQQNASHISRKKVKNYADGGAANPVKPTRFNFGNGAQGTPYKSGGKAHKDEKEDRALINKMVKPSARTGKLSGGEARVERASGGRTKAKGKTNINIVIQAGSKDPAIPPGAVGPTKPPLPPAPPPMSPSPAGGPPMGAGMPPGMPSGLQQGLSAGLPPVIPPMGRKAGGRIPHMTAGSESGKGRLEKIELQKRSERKSGGRAKSYKDMTAGAGSGEGRLEKTEIEKSR